MSKGYEEGGEQLENLSAFTGTGFESFPALYHDTQRLHDVSDEEKWPQPLLEARVNEYGEFTRRKDNMPRAQKTATRILNHLIQELACRDGVYPQQFREDELCNGNE